MAKMLIALVVFMICMAILFNFILINIQKKTLQTSYNANGVTMVQMLAYTIRLAVFAE